MLFRFGICYPWAFWLKDFSKHHKTPPQNLHFGPHVVPLFCVAYLRGSGGAVWGAVVPHLAAEASSLSSQQHPIPPISENAMDGWEGMHTP